MIADARDYEKNLDSVGSGSFGEVEYDGTTKIVLRTAGIKTSEVSGSVRMYFDAMRNEVLSGRRFEPFPSQMLRQNVVYKIITPIRVADLPPGVTLKVSLTDDACDVFMLVHDRPVVSEEGDLTYMVMPFRRIDLARWTAPARLSFDVETLVMKMATPKPAPKKPAPKKEKKDEGSVSSKPASTGKD